MSRSLLTALALISMGSTAFAAANGPDVTTTIIAPAVTPLVDDLARYQVRVSNIGNLNAASVSLVIQLPRTHTAPQVYVMGNLGPMSPNCTRVGTNLNCALGQIKRTKSTTVYFDIALPQSAAPLTFVATASTAGDINTGNDSATRNAALQYYSVPINAPRNAHVRHCTGTGLTAFFECTMFPSSIAFHDIVFLPGATSNDGTISIPAAPTYSGAWTRSGTHLSYQYINGAQIVAEFEGEGVQGSCYHGLTTFPGSTYVAPYEVCLQP